MIKEVNNKIIEYYNTHLAEMDNSCTEHINMLRREAIANFATYSLPTLKDEEYKYSDIEVWVLEALLRFGAPISKVSKEGQFKQYPDGVVVCDINTFAVQFPDIFKRYYTRSVEDDTLMTLSRAFALDGVVVYVPSRVVCSELIELELENSGVTLGERNLLIFERDSLAKIHLTHKGESLTNSVTEIFLEQGANVEMSEEYFGSTSSTRVGTISVSVERGAYYTHISINNAKGRHRVSESVSLRGVGAEAAIYGAVHAEGEAHIDNYTLIKHQVEKCRSFELFKTVAKDNSTAIFNGNIYVAAGADQTEAFQQNNNILLSNEATIYTKPNLEIYADDVKCSHGATVGQLNNDAIFYMEQRGVPRAMAQELLLKGFLMEVVDKISSRSVVDRIKGVEEDV